jgi:Cytotoxic
VIPPPEFLKAFPLAKPAKPKTRLAPGLRRTRWKEEKSGMIYEWDSRHGRVEKYNWLGKHQGEFNPETGQQTKPANPRRTIEP